MRFLGGLIIIAVAVTVIGCSSGLNINTDYDPSAAPKLSAYKTYSWLPRPRGGDDRVNNPIVASRIAIAVDSVLAAKGYQKRTSGSTDFKVGYHAAIQGKVDYTTVNSYYGYGYGRWGPGGYGTSVSSTTAREYSEGTLVIDIVDTPSNQLVWRSSAQAELDEQATPEERQALIFEAASQMFAGFPPGG